MTQRTRAPVWLFLSATWLLIGCTREPSQPDKAAAPPSEQPLHTRTKSTGQAAEAGLPRAAKLQGELASDTPLAEGARVARDQIVTLARGAALTLHYPGGTSVRVVGPARIAVAPWGEEALLLREGAAVIDRESGAQHPGSGFWVATPKLRAELVQGARLVVRVLADGETLLRVVSGSLTYLGAVEEEPAPLSAGQGLRATASGRASVHPHATPTLEAAEHALRALPESGPGAPSPALASELKVALDTVVRDLSREQELLAQHRALSARRDPAAAKLQQTLAEHGGQAFQNARRLRTRLAVTYAAWLGETPPGELSGLLSRARAHLRVPQHP